MYKDDLVYEFNDDMWYLYHNGTIDNSDDFERETIYWLENKVIYKDDCKKYINELNVHNPFEDHDIFGRANDWYQAGYNALWDLLHEHDEVLTFDKMVEQNENA